MGGVAVQGSKKIVDGNSGAKTFIHLSRILICTLYIKKYWCDCYFIFLSCFAYMKLLQQKILSVV